MGNLTTETIIGGIAGLYVLGILIVFISGEVPRAWQSWNTVSCVALIGLPAFLIAAAIGAAIPGLLLLGFIAAISSPYQGNRKR